MPRRLYETSAGTAGSITRFHYDGDELVGEYSAPAAGAPLLLRRYVHGAGVDDPLVWMEGAGVTAAATRRLRGNHQGSIVAVADNAGAPIAINAYDEWGIPAATNVGRFQYTGQIWLPELGLYYYKARIYSPTLGRFMQTDPIGYEDHVNLYAHVGNDPVNKVYSTGTDSMCVSIPGSCFGDPNDPQTAVRQQRAGDGLVTSIITAPIGGIAGQLITQIGVPVVRLKRGSEIAKPIESGKLHCFNVLQQSAKV